MSSHKPSSASRIAESARPVGKTTHLRRLTLGNAWPQRQKHRLADKYYKRTLSSTRSGFPGMNILAQIKEVLQCGGCFPSVARSYVGARAGRNPAGRVEGGDLLPFGAGTPRCDRSAFRKSAPYLIRHIRLELCTLNACRYLFDG